MILNITEAEVKKAVEDYLQYQQNLGKLLFLRLNAGDFIEVRGETRRRIKGTPAGTSDFIVFQPVEYSLTRFGQSFVTCKPTPGCKVTFLEIKSSKGKTSKEQDEFAEKVRQINCRYFVIRDVNELEEILR